LDRHNNSLQASTSHDPQDRYRTETRSVAQQSASLSAERSALKSPLFAGASDARPGQILHGRPVRVLVVAPRFLPDLGGIESHTYEVTRRIAMCGELEPTILVTDPSRSLPKREELEGFTVLRCRCYPRHQDFYFAPEIYRSVISRKYDLIHCQGIHSAVPILAMMAARQVQIPYVVTFHTGGHSSGFRNRLRGVQWRALRPLLRNAAGLVAVSRFERRLFQKACNIDASRIRVIHNGGDLPSGASQAEAIPGRIVSSGRLERYKGHHRIIEALPIVQRTIPYASLQILGSGPYEGRLRSLINSLGLEKSVTIEYIPPGDRLAMAESLGSAAVVAALSEYEAHPVAVMEALALGIPTVGLNTAGIGDLVEDGLVEGVPRNASSTAIARILLAVLEGRCVSSSARLPTWDMAASDVADVYWDALGVTPGSVRA
jgi:glycosyltransferase involved in cell wall biosynthesis